MKLVSSPLFLSTFIVLLFSSQVFLPVEMKAQPPLPQKTLTLEEELLANFENAKKYHDVPSTLLLLKIIVDDALRKGKQAPDYNLCNLEVASTNLFCKENKGIARIKMPQLNGKPVAGSKADKLPKNERGEVDAKNDFAEYLEKSKKYTITEINVPAAELKATQNELIGSKVAGIWSAMQDPKSKTYKDITEGYVFVSKDNFILDGHHRWAAAVARAISNGNLSTVKMKAKKIDATIDQLLNDANQFAKEFGIQAEAGL